MKKIFSLVILIMFILVISGCEQEVTCDDGYENRNGVCYEILPLNCNEGFEEVDGSCVEICLDNEELIDGTCQLTSCPDNYTLTEGECILTSCPSDSRLEDGECVKVNCAPGFIVENGVCVEDDDIYAACKGTKSNYDRESLVYELVFSDEFDGTELNLDNWRYEVNGNGGGNNELQYYTSSNVVLEDGILKIIAEKEDYLGKSYTSSRITTQYKHEFKYGKIEFRAKLPGGRGTWPALWMMPANSSYGGWPNSGEIDVVELVGYDPNKIHGTVHTASFNHKDNTDQGKSFFLSTATEEFHVYSIEWLPDKIIFSVDDTPYFTFSPKTFINCPSSNHWPFDKSFFLIMNVAIGGDWGGVQGVDNSIFPVAMEVDYVRVYQSETITNLE